MLNEKTSLKKVTHGIIPFTYYFKRLNFEIEVRLIFARRKKDERSGCDYKRTKQRDSCRISIFQNLVTETYPDAKILQKLMHV